MKFLAAPEVPKLQLAFAATIIEHIFTSPLYLSHNGGQRSCELKSEVFCGFGTGGGQNLEILAKFFGGD